MAIVCEPADGLVPALEFFSLLLMTANAPKPTAISKIAAATDKPMIRPVRLFFGGSCPYGVGGSGPHADGWAGGHGAWWPWYGPVPGGGTGPWGCAQGR